MANNTVLPELGRFIPGSGDSLQRRFQSIFDAADVRINGDRPWDFRVHNRHTFTRMLTSGSLGFGEAYVNGWWDCDRLDQLFTRVLQADVHKKVIGLAKVKLAFTGLWYALVNRQSASRAYRVGEIHYDIGNDLYSRMLDSTMSYSCGYWAEAEDLEQAQRHKLDLICRKLKLSPGMTLLDVGCGWGGLAEFAAKHYQVEVVGVTISREQQKLAQERVKGLPVDIRLIDYRQVQGQFDRVVSVGMFEHVGPKNYRTFFETAKQRLKPDGLFLLHTIGEETTSYASDPFIEKYIFPNGKVASRKHFSDASIELLRLEDWHNFGPDYDNTLMAWAQRFEQSWPEIADNYSEPFYRMWRYYLYSCAGFFRARKGQLWQAVYAHPDRREVYRSVR